MIPLIAIWAAVVGVFLYAVRVNARQARVGREVTAVCRHLEIELRRECYGPDGEYYMVVRDEEDSKLHTLAKELGVMWGTKEVA